MTTTGLVSEAFRFNEPRLIDFETIADDVSLIRPGDTVVNFTDKKLQQVDGLVAAVTQLVFVDTGLICSVPRSIPRGTSSVANGNWQARQKLPSEALTVTGFAGDFVNATVTPLSGLQPAYDKTQPARLDLLLTADRRTTGRGIVGHSVSLLKVSEAPNVQSLEAYARGTSLAPTRSRRVTYVDLTKKLLPEARELEATLREATEPEARLAVLVGLRKALRLEEE